MTAVFPEFRLPPQHAATSGVGEAEMKGRLVVLSVLLAAVEWVSTAAKGPDEFRPPINLQVDPFIRPVVDRMWQASPTFRRQCRRLAAEPELKVTLSREDQPSRASFANARTAFMFRGNVLVGAQVYLKPSEKGAEFIAHELEHILEQLDGVDLDAQAGNGAVWKGDRTSFETRRAIEVGRRVAREIIDGAAGIGRHHGTQVNAGDVIATLRRQNRDATPVSQRGSRVSGNGRYVVFISSAALVDQDRNRLRDVYVTDLETGRTTLESVGPDGTAADGESRNADISGDGRYIVFESEARNLTAGQFSGGTSHIFLRDRAQGTIRLLTTNATGEPANGPSWNPVISANAEAVAVESAATDLVRATDCKRLAVGIYLISLPSGKRTRLDIARPGGLDAAGSSMSPAIDAAGRYTVFASKADLTCGEAEACIPERRDRNHVSDVYIFDAGSNGTRRISLSRTGGDADGASYQPTISGDGRFVAFVSEASNLTAESNGRHAQLYVHDLTSGSTTLVSRTAFGQPANGSTSHPSLSFDGSTNAFQSLATNLLCERKCHPDLADINLLPDVFVSDLRTHRVLRMSADGGEEWMETSRGASMDAAGRLVTFGSWHPTDAGDRAHDEDVFVIRIELARPPLTRQR